MQTWLVGKMPWRCPEELRFPGSSSEKFSLFESEDCIITKLGQGYEPIVYILAYEILS